MYIDIGIRVGVRCILLVVQCGCCCALVFGFGFAFRRRSSSSGGSSFHLSRGSGEGWTSFGSAGYLWHDDDIVVVDNDNRMLFFFSQGIVFYNRKGMFFCDVSRASVKRSEFVTAVANDFYLANF